MTYLINSAAKAFYKNGEKIWNNIIVSLYLKHDHMYVLYENNYNNRLEIDKLSFKSFNILWFSVIYVNLNVNNMIFVISVKIID